MHRPLVIACIAACASLAMAGTAEAQVQFGVQANLADDVDFGVGARVVGPLGQALGFDSDEPLSKLRGVASFDLYFPDWDGSYFEINGNATYPLETETSFTPYVGGGLNIARWSVDIPGGGSASDTDVGLNVLGGIDFDLGDLGAFAEAKIEAGGGEQFILTFGILLGGS